MNILFFIVFPLATILISIVLQRLLKCPTLVAIFAFAIFLILAFTAYTTEFLINAIVYTLIAFITASLVRTLCCIRRKIGCNNCCDETNENNLSEEIVELRNSINNLEQNIDSLENNIDNLTETLARLICNNCGCNNRRF